MRHARGFYPCCLARANRLWCGCEDRTLRQNNRFVCVCVVLCSTWMNKNVAMYPLVVSFVHHVKSFVRRGTTSNITYQLCVSCLMAKFGFTARVNGFECRVSFWPENKLFGKLGETLWICVYYIKNKRHSFKKCV